MSVQKTVSVIVPCYNEEGTILLLLDALIQQTYPLEAMEVVIADGMSTDHTRRVISEFQAFHPDFSLRIIDNEKRAIPSGLNRAIESAGGHYIIRLDAHSVPDHDYIERCISALDQDLGDNVGGVWNIQAGAATWIARSIATAASHPLGVGDALYRIGAKAQIVDTVPFGAFRRDLALAIGLYDESLLTNEDYEFNTRIRQQGGKIWLDPSIKSKYYARSSITALAKQYWRYGFWKAQMLKRYPKTIRWRQLLPPLLSGSLLVLLPTAIFLPWARNLLAVELVLYLGCLLVVGIHMALRKKSVEYLVGLPLAIATMHITWGFALIWGIIHPTHHHPTITK